MDEASYDVNWRIYWEGELLYSGNDYGSNVRLNKDVRYTVFAWANTSPDTGSCEALASSTHSWTDDRSSWSSAPQYHRIPMSFSRSGISAQELDLLDGAKDGVITLPLERTMAKVNLSVEFDALVLAMFPDENISGEHYGISVDDVLLGGICQSVGLFDPQLNSRSASTGDITVSQSDEGSGKPVYTFYVPESLGGDILYGNTNPLNKSASALEAKGLEPSAYPYIETKMSFSSYMSNGSFSKTFRFYIGEDQLSNFDVRRNSIYDITLRISYNGLDISGEWKLDGDSRNDLRSLGLDVQDYSVSPGESTVILMDYKWNDGSNISGTMYLRSNGFAVGAGGDRDSYLANGTEPGSLNIRQLESDHYMLVCKSCLHHYTDFPKNISERAAWRESKLSTSGTKVYCRWCGTLLFDMTGSSGDLYCFNNISSTYNGSTTKCITQDSNYLEITVPGSCSVGSTLSVFAWTRDGKLQSQADIQVKLSGTPTLVSGRNGNCYVGQRDLIRVTDWPIGTYGTDPEFTFEISARNPQNNADATTAVLSTSGLSGDLARRSVYVNCQKSGSYTVRIKYGGAVVAGAELNGSIAYPTIGYPDGADNDYGISGITVFNGGGQTRFSKPCFIINDSGGWEEYTDFDPGLKSAWLGDVAGNMADDNGWISYSEASACAVNLSHAYRGGVVSDSNLVPYRTPETRLDLIRYRATSANVRTGGMADFDIPVYFDTKFRNLSTIASRIYTEYDAYEGYTYSNPDMTFYVNSYWPAQTLETYDGFYGQINGTEASISKVVTYRGNGLYNFVTSGPVGVNSVMWRLKGSGSDSYSLEVCKLTHKKKYVGNIVTTCDEHVKNKYYAKMYGAFAQWCDASSNLFYPLKAQDGAWNVVYYDIPLPAFSVYVSCEHVYKPLFRLQQTAVLPTEGPYDPDPSLDGKLPPFNGNYPWVHSSAKAVFYDRARHVYDNSNLSYTAMMTRWCSYYFFGIITTMESYGFDMEQYKSFNSPLFRPVDSPYTVDGISWVKTSDNGTTAIWNSADGLMTCEFKYGEWQ